MIDVCQDIQIAGVILAAGGSERFGGPKQLLNWQGEPFVTRVARTSLEAGLTPLVVVIGADHQQVETALRGLPLRTVYNPKWSQGQSISMKAGLNALPNDCEGVMFLLSDQPQIPSRLIQQLIDRYMLNRAPITAPKAGGRRGNPVLFGQEAFPALHQVTGDKGGRAVFDQFEVDWLPWEDERILLDVDDDTDLETLREAYGNKG